MKLQRLQVVRVQEVRRGKEPSKGTSWVCNAGSGGVTGVAAGIGIVLDCVVSHS